MQLTNVYHLDKHIVIGFNFPNTYLKYSTCSDDYYYKFINYKENDNTLNIDFESNVELELYKSYFGIRYKVLLNNKTLFIGLIEEKYLTNYNHNETQLSRLIKNFCNWN